MTCRSGRRAPLRLCCFTLAGFILLGLTLLSASYAGSRASQSSGGLTPPWPPLASADAAATDLRLDPASSALRRNVYLVLDGSGSMLSGGCGPGRKIDTARRALIEYVRALPPDVALGLAVFDLDGASQRLPLDTGNREQLVAEMEAIRPGAGTPLLSVMRFAYDALTASARDQLGYGDYRIVVITDGAASLNEDPGPLVARINAESPVVVHTIGFCIGTDHVLNQPGQVRYTPADDYRSLRLGLESVLAEAPDFSVMAFEQ